MTNYIKADIYRITHKKGLYIYIGVASLILCLFLFFLKKSFSSIQTEEAYFSMASEFVQAFFVLLFGIYIFVTVYCNDFSSKSLTNILSTGLNRGAMIFSKIFVSMFFLLITYTLGALILLGGAYFFIGSVSSSQAFNFYQITLLSIFIQLAYFSIISILTYFVQNTILPVVLLIVLLVTNIVSTIFSLLSSYSSIFKFAQEHFLDHYAHQLLGNFEKNGELFSINFVAVLIYLVLGGIVASFIFQRVNVKNGE